MVVLRRVNEGLTQDNWKAIKDKLAKAAGKRKLALSDIKLTGFSICDKRNSDLCVKFDMNLMDTSAGEIIIKSGGKTWKMGETQIRDRKTGGTKKPNMDAQVENILDFAESQMEKN